jgi:3-phosphoglycerate kinase
MNKLTVENLDVFGKTVMVRVDFNVPLNENQQVTDDTRIVASLPTIRFLLENGARLILVSHLGRPKGNPKPELSLEPVAVRLSELLGKPVVFKPFSKEINTISPIDELKNGDCLLMENIRFYPEEEQNDEQFSKSLASLADKFVNDAFGTAHRAHASNVGVARHFSDAACGFLIKKELEYLGSLILQPKNPFCAILGGAKVKDKIKVIANLLDKTDHILVGGGMAYSFLKVLGHKIGNSILDADHLNLVDAILKKASDCNKQIHLPVDHIVADEFKNDATIQTVDTDIPNGFMGMDIGPKTINKFLEIINQSATVFWNGPMGVFEMSSFQEGTFSIAHGLAKANAVTVVGGGDSVAAVNKINIADQITHISTGGGASLELLEGKSLPGIDILSEVK